MDHQIISSRDIESFQRDGAVCLRGLFDKKWIDIVRQGIEKTIADPSDMHRVAKVDGESGHFFKDYHMSRRLPEFRNFVFESPAGPATAALLRSSRINFFYDVLWI